jgi:cellulose synthase/poly-beta-1,6-N-acetylglucosamine synthase-like glycosyltransferase
LTEQGTILVQVLAVAMALSAAPLFFDLAVCLVGNLRRVHRPVAVGGVRAIRMAVVVPAHDEQEMIAGTVHSLLAAVNATPPSPATPALPVVDGESAQAIPVPAIPVYVVAHNCSDATAAVAAAAGAEVLVLNNPLLLGKAAALRYGFLTAQTAGANAFLAVDADSLVSTNLIAATRAALQSGAAATQCRYELEPSTGSFRPLARLRVMAFRGINVLRARGRAYLGFSAGLFGNGFAVTSETLEQVPFSVDSIVEDIEYHTRLVVAGMRVRWVEEAYVYAPLSAPGTAQATQEARWEGGRFHVATRSTGRLVAAVLSGNWQALEMLAEVWSLPLSRGLMALLLISLLPLYWAHVFALVCALITVGYVLGSAWIGAEPWLDLAAMMAVPLHIVWKAAITPLVLRQTRKRAEWARTRREARQP